jgi:hypothetical protein
LIWRKYPVLKRDEPIITNVQTQFYIDQIGWVNADPTNYTRGKDPNNWSEKLDYLLQGFGIDDAKSMVSGIEGLNFTDMPCYGPKLLDQTGPTIPFEHKLISSDWILNEVVQK